ncbi:DUF7739 domain-containing protein [Streptomyces aculeolatus]
MGRNISHGTNPDGEIRRSYTTIGNLADQVAHVLPAADWRRLQPILKHGSGDPFDVPPHLAASTAALLRKAADHRLMPDDWAEEARELAAAADQAAGRGEMWSWR